jgi:hypothetical protein
MEERTRPKDKAWAFVLRRRYRGGVGGRVGCGSAAVPGARLAFPALVVAVVALAGTGLLPRWPGILHAVALPPLDLGFDLRLLVARAPSYPVLAGGVLLSVTVRSVVLASVLGVVGMRASFRSRLRFAGALYAMALVPLGVAAALHFAAAAAVFAWYGWVALGLAIVTVLLLGPRAFRPVSPAGLGRRTGVLALSLLVLAILGGVARVGGPWSAVALVPASAWATWQAIRWQTRGGGRRRKRTPPKGAAAMVAVLLAAIPPAAPSPGSSVRERTAAPDPVLLLVPGLDTISGSGSVYRLDPAALGVPCERVLYYSYRGPPPRPRRFPPPERREAPCPLRLHAPYQRTDTQRSLEELVDEFAAQVSRARRRWAGSPIHVVTHSQGAWIAWRAVTSGRAPGVARLVMLAGFPRSPVGYPPLGGNGAGRVGADALRLLSGVFRRSGAATFDPDAPLAREMLAVAGASDRLFREPLPPGVPATGVLPVLDAAAAPAGRELPGVPAVQVLSTHVGITESPAAHDAVRRALAGAPPAPSVVLGPVVDALLPAFLAPPEG